MTLKQVKAMTNVQWRDRVAELCGGVWKKCECGAAFCNRRCRWHWPDGTITDDCPDYPNDLNDMNEAAMRLNDAGLNVMVYHRYDGESPVVFVDTKKFQQR